MDRELQSSGDAFAAGVRFVHEGVAVGLRNDVGEPVVLVAIPALNIPPSQAAIESITTQSGRSGRWIFGVLAAAGLMGGLAWAYEQSRPAATPDDDALLLASVEPTPSAPAPPSAPPPLTGHPPAAPAAALWSDAEADVRQARQHPRRPRPARSARSASDSAVTVEHAGGAAGLPDVEVRAAMVPLHERLRRCHAEVFGRGPVTDRRIVAHLTIRGATVASIAPRSSIRSPRLWSCLRGVLMTARFGRAPSYAEATVTLHFGPPS